MRRWIVMILCALIGIAAVIFSLLNLQMVSLDLVAGTVTMPLGVLVLLAVLLGAALSGLLWMAYVIVPMRMRGSSDRKA